MLFVILYSELNGQYIVVILFCAAADAINTTFENRKQTAHCPFCDTVTTDEWDINPTATTTKGRQQTVRAHFK